MRTVEDHFQNTAIGKIPMDWEVKKLGEIVDFHDNKRKPIKESERKPGIYPYYGASGIIDYVDDFIFDDDYILLAEDGANILTRSTPIAFRISGKAWVNNHAHVLKPKIETDIDFLTYYLEFINYEKYNSGTAQPKLNRKVCETIDIAFPNTSERKKIGEILSIWDKAIELKEKLIEQKKEQKKGLMQKLLTGEVRLPGFDSKWSNVKIGNIIKEINEKSTVNNQFQVLSVTKDGIVSQSEHFKKQVASDNNIGYKIIRKNNLVFSTMNLWMGSLDVLTNYEVGLVSPAYKVFKFNDEVMDPIFGKYFMKTEHMIWLYNVNSEQGASVVRRNLDLKGLLNTYVNIPSLEEQRNIARVIFCLDTEIDLLEHETKQLIKQKKGLMQLLLTGKVRVKV